MRGPNIIEELVKANEDAEFYVRRVRMLLMELEARRPIQIQKREREPEVESKDSIYFCRVPESFTGESLKKHLAVHGEIVDFFFHDKSRWGRATYKYPEQQENCLSQRDFYQDELGITVQPHKSKRVKI